MKAHQSDSKLQNQIYSYMEHFTPYTKQQFINEVNEHAIKKSEDEVRTHERNLQKEINQIMPDLVKKWKNDCAHVDVQRAAYKGTEKPEHVFRYPRRKFQWNENLK